MIDSFSSSGNSSLFQIKLISFWISERIALLPALISAAGILSVPSDLLIYSFSITISNLWAIGSGTSGYAVCISICLASLTQSILFSWATWFQQVTKILWEFFKQITLLILYCIIYGLLTLLKVIDAPIQIPHIVYLIVSFNFFNFSFRISFFFLTCLLDARLQLYRLSTLFWFGTVTTVF